VPDSKAPLVICALGGDDVITAAGLEAPPMQFIFDGGDGNDRLHGSAGVDRLIGGGADRFQFSGSNETDTIADFQDGSDVIRITGYGRVLDSFSDLAMTQDGTSVRIDLGAKAAGAGVILLQNTRLADIGGSDVSFG
jgi:Ca2+-binding RTX toxin-like protein